MKQRVSLFFKIVIYSYNLYPQNGYRSHNPEINCHMLLRLIWLGALKHRVSLTVLQYFWTLSREIKYRYLLHWCCLSLVPSSTGLLLSPLTPPSKFGQEGCREPHSESETCSQVHYPTLCEELTCFLLWQILPNLSFVLTLSLMKSTLRKVKLLDLSLKFHSQIYVFCLSF